MIVWVDTETTSVAVMGSELTATAAFVQGQWQGQIIIGGGVSAPVAIFAAGERDAVKSALASWVIDFSARLAAWVAPTE